MPKTSIKFLEIICCVHTKVYKCVHVYKKSLCEGPVKIVIIANMGYHLEIKYFIIIIIIKR